MSSTACRSATRNDCTDGPDSNQAIDACIEDTIDEEISAPCNSLEAQLHLARIHSGAAQTVLQCLLIQWCKNNSFSFIFPFPNIFLFVICSPFWVFISYTFSFDQSNYLGLRFPILQSFTVIMINWILQQQFMRLFLLSLFISNGVIFRIPPGSLQSIHCQINQQTNLTAMHNLPSMNN